MQDNDMTMGLQAPFEDAEVDWVIISSGGYEAGSVWVLVAPYLKNKTIQDRLDKVMGPENWKNTFEKWGQAGVLCGLSLKINGEWITKYDGAEESEIEAVKGGLSGSMKRAAQQWGIGRYLADIPKQIIKVSSDKKGKYRSQLKDNKLYYWNPPKLAELSGPGSPGNPAPRAADKGKYITRIHELQDKLSALADPKAIYDPLLKAFNVSTPEDLDISTLEQFGKKLVLLIEYSEDLVPLMDQLEVRDGARLRKTWKMASWYDFDFKADQAILKSRMHNILEAIKMTIAEKAEGKNE